MASFQSCLSIGTVSKSLGREANQIEGPALLTGIKSPLRGSRSPGFRVKPGFECLIRCVTALGTSSSRVKGPIPRLLRTTAVVTTAAASPGRLLSQDVLHVVYVNSSHSLTAIA